MKLKQLRTLCSLLTILVTPAICLGAAEDAQPISSEPRELVVLNWSDYLDPELVEEFEQEFNAKVREIYYADDDERDSMLAESSGRGYDVALVNGAQLAIYRKQGWLAPMTAANVPNLRHINRRWLNEYEAAPGYAIPYFWGTLGIGYRSDLISERIVSWKQLFQPSEDLRGKLTLLGSSREVIGMALKALGYSANSSDPRELAEAKRLLMAQKPHVQSYEYVDIDEHSELVSGDVWIAMMFSGDALMVQEHHPDIVYVLPEEGGNLWVDYLTVMQHSQNKELAMAFINFLNEPRNAARLAEFVYYATPNEAAEEFLPEEFFEDPTIYPEARDLAKSEPYTELSPRVLKKRNRLFQDVIR